MYNETLLPYAFLVNTFLNHGDGPCGFLNHGDGPCGFLNHGDGPCGFLNHHSDGK
ncbi:MAG: hypothetical protein K5686_04395 [Lachnospiraceae bacterium]|nr:hypothetical protein [Lachnospiraceae bacterium]